MGSRNRGGPSLRVGLTGGMGSGKSTVADLLAERGAVIIDADVVAREVVEPGTAALAALVERFGTAILTADGHLDRGGLAAIIFADPDARRDAEAAIHPAVRARAAELEAASPDGSIVVHVIPLLVETGQQNSFDQVVVVDVDPATQLARVVSRDGSHPADAQARIAAQASRERRLSAADVVLDNSSGPEQLRTQVDALWQRWHHRSK